MIDCPPSKKYCEAIVDELLLFTLAKKSHKGKLEDLIKALLKNRLKTSPKNVNCLRGHNRWTIPFLYKGKECMYNTHENED